MQGNSKLLSFAPPPLLVVNCYAIVKHYCIVNLLLIAFLVSKGPLGIPMRIIYVTNFVDHGTSVM